MKVQRIRRMLVMALTVSMIMAVAGATGNDAMAESAFVFEEVTAGQGHLAPKGSQAGIRVDTAFVGGGKCEGYDTEGTMGKNPAETVKATFPNKDVPHKICQIGSKQANGALSFKSMAISHAGTFTLSLVSTIESWGGCKYELKQVVGSWITKTFTESYEYEGTAKLQRHTGSPPSCQKTVAASGVLDYFPVGGFGGVYSFFKG